MIANLVTRIGFRRIDGMWSGVKKALSKAFIIVAMRIRQFYMGSPRKASLDGVYLHPLPSPKSIGFQDLLLTSRLGMIDITTSYKKRLGFSDPATQLNNVDYSDVWSILAKGIDGLDVKEPGRVEVDFTDHNGNKRSIVVTPEESSVVVPLYRKKQSKLSIGIFKVELEVRRMDIDENGEEISFCGEAEEDDTVVKAVVTEEFRRWIPNKNVMDADDDTLFRLALRDSIFWYPELYDIFNPPFDREKFKYEVDAKIIYSNLSHAHRTLAFDWETYPEGVVVGRSN